MFLLYESKFTKALKTSKNYIYILHFPRHDKSQKICQYKYKYIPTYIICQKEHENKETNIMCKMKLDCFECFDPHFSM